MELNSYQTIAKAIRVEYEESTDTIYLVFEVVDEQFKQEIRKDWTQDTEFKVIGRSLIRK